MNNLKISEKEIPEIALLGSFPPLRGLSSYCLELTLSIAKWAKVEFISFKKIYPHVEGKAESKHGP